MARTDNLTNFLDDVAVAIKSKKGYESTQKIPAEDFDTEISSITTVNNQNKTITPTTSQQIITADQGYTGIGTATVQPVTSSIDQNIVAGNIKKDVVILGVTGSYEGTDTSDATATASDILLNKTAYANGIKLTGSYVAEDLNDVITAQENKLDALETILEGKISNAGDGSKMNIFVQTDEPTVKKGIWLKTDKQMEHVTCDEEIFVSGEWSNTGLTTDFYASDSQYIIIGNYAYIFRSGSAYKYNLTNNELTRLTSYNTYAFTNDGAIVSVGTDIYLLGGNSSTSYQAGLKYDTLTDTYTNISIPIKMYMCTAANVGTDIYIFSPYYQSDIYKYDTVNEEWTKMNATIASSSYKMLSVSVGTSIYIFGVSGDICKKYDTVNDVIITDSSIPSNPFNCKSIAAIGTDIYVFAGNNRLDNCYKYDTINKTYTSLSSPQSLIYMSPKGINNFYNNKLYFFGCSTTASDYDKAQVYNLTSKTYQQDELVVISQGRYNDVGYEIELFSNNKMATQPKYAFADAWYYTIQGGLETDIPTYYGNGTTWINIKNPPQNQGGAE